MLSKLLTELKSAGDLERAKNFKWFFKTGKGEYGEGDQFLGIAVPHLREISKKYQTLDLKDLQELLDSKIHEHRLSSLMILRMKYQNANTKDQSAIVRF